MCALVIISDTSDGMITLQYRVGPRHGHNSSSLRLSTHKLRIQSYADHERLVLGKAVLQIVDTVVGDLGGCVNDMHSSFVVCLWGGLYGFLCLNVRPRILRANAVSEERSASIANIRPGILGCGSFSTPFVIVHEKTGWRKPRVDEGLCISPRCADCIGCARTESSLL